MGYQRGEEIDRVRFGRANKARLDFKEVRLLCRVLPFSERYSDVITLLVYLPWVHVQRPFYELSPKPVLHNALSYSFIFRIPSEQIIATPLPHTARNTAQPYIARTIIRSSHTPRTPIIVVADVVVVLTLTHIIIESVVTGQAPVLG